MIVVDASVFNKLFLDEADKSLASDFFLWALQNNILVGFIDLLSLEVCQTALHFNIPCSVPFNILDTYKGAGFRELRIRRAHWLKAEEIAKTGHPKSGFPQLIDSLYHAVAILEDGVFLTADRRHVTKAKGFGAVVLLDDWETLKGKF